MDKFDVDEMVIWTSPHTHERVSMSFRGNTGLTFCALYNVKTGMQVIAPLDEVEHDWRRICEVEETNHAQTRTELAYVMQERNEYLNRAEAAEARAAQAEAERDEARRALEQAQERIKQLEHETAYFQSTDFAADKHLAQLERTAPVDWRGHEANETPLGQQLDGGGDEVES